MSYSSRLQLIFRLQALGFGHVCPSAGCLGKATATGGVLLAGFENRTRHFPALSGCWYNLLAETEHNLNVG